MPSTPTAKQLPTLDYAEFFDALVVPCMAYEVKPPYRIFAENRQHEKVALVKRKDVIGRGFLEAFPDTSPEYARTGKSVVIESLKRCAASGKPDAMPNIRYDIKDKTGKYVTRYWSATHYPLFDANKKVMAVYQVTEDVTDKLETEHELETTRYQLSQALENGAIGVWSWDIPEQRVTGDNNLAFMFGIDVTKARIGLPLDDFVAAIHEDDRERIANLIEQSVNTRSLFEEEYRTRASDGTVRWVFARGRVEIDEQGNAKSFPGVVVDITDRKNAESQVVESENRLRFMADSMPQLMWMARPDGYREYFNEKWYVFTGSTGEQNEGNKWSNFAHPDDRARVRKAWAHSVKTGEPYEVEYRLYNAPTSSYRWLIGRGLPFRDASGKIVKWYGTSTDIDEQKRATELEAFLASASKKLSSSLDYRKTLKQVSKLCVPNIADWCSVDLYDQAKDTYEQVSVAHADPKKVSLAIEHRKHYPPTNDGTTGVSKVIHTGKSEFYPNITEEMLRASITEPKKLKFMLGLNLHSIIISPISVNGKSLGAISFVSTDSGRYYTKNDLHMAEELATRISLAITNSTLYNESTHELKRRKKLEKELLLEQQKLEFRVRERTEQLQLTNQGLREEIVKRHAIENELQKNSENLARSNQELQDFAYVASHDLQEPLRKIQAFGNLLESEYGKDLGEGADYLKRMRNAASRMSTLIEDLLSFSRVTTKAKPSVDVNLNEIVSEVLQDLESRIEETGGVVDVEDLPTVKADPTHMRQLFQNLISNALKFHKPHESPHVKVEFTGDGPDYYEMHVVDNGIGFDQKYIDRIFAVFQRLHERDAYEGTGIGLAVVRKIVERYGGTITAKSSKNNGATFIMRLPKKNEGDK